MAKSSGKVTIKKYANRRLYDTESSAYITLDRLAQMVREGREFEVVDAKTGEDITRQVLTQIIVDEEARGGTTMLPINFLKQLIGLYGNSMQNFVPQYLEAAMDAFQRNQSAAKDAFGGNMFADIAKRNMAMFEDASRAFGAKAKPKRSRKKRQRRGAIEGRTRRPPGQSRPAEPLIVMRLPIAAALALTAASALYAQAIPDLSTATPLAGSWKYTPSSGGSEASYPMCPAIRSYGCMHPRNTARDHCETRQRGGAIRRRMDELANAQHPIRIQSCNGQLTVSFARPIRFWMHRRQSRPCRIHRRDPAGAGRAAWAEIARVIEDCRA